GRLPAVGFALMLSVLAAAGGRGRWPWAVGLLLFMLGDWAMQALLPRFGVSYGPPQPVSLVLAVARAVCGLLPVAWALPLEIAGSVLAGYALWIEPHTIGVTRQTLHSAKLARGAPIRVLHVSDLHVERI